MYGACFFVALHSEALLVMVLGPVSFDGILVVIVLLLRRLSA